MDASLMCKSSFLYLIIEYLTDEENSLLKICQDKQTFLICFAQILQNYVQCLIMKLKIVKKNKIYYSIHGIENSMLQFLRFSI